MSKLNSNKRQNYALAKKKSLVGSTPDSILYIFFALSLLNFFSFECINVVHQIISD